jgi:hypothetical protein
VNSSLVYLAGFAAPDELMLAHPDRGHKWFLLDIVDHLVSGSSAPK